MKTLLKQRSSIAATLGYLYGLKGPVGGTTLYRNTSTGVVVVIVGLWPRTPTRIRH